MPGCNFQPTEPYQNQPLKLAPVLLNVVSLLALVLLRLWQVFALFLLVPLRARLAHHVAPAFAIAFVTALVEAFALFSLVPRSVAGVPSDFVFASVRH